MRRMARSGGGGGGVGEAGSGGERSASAAVAMAAADEGRRGWPEEMKMRRRARAFPASHSFSMGRQGPLSCKPISQRQSAHR